MDLVSLVVVVIVSWFLLKASTYPHVFIHRNANVRVGETCHWLHTSSTKVSRERWYFESNHLTLIWIGLSAFIFVALVNIGAAIAFFRYGTDYMWCTPFLIACFRPPRFQTGIGLPLILVVSNLVVAVFPSNHISRCLTWYLFIGLPNVFIHSSPQNSFSNLPSRILQLRARVTPTLTELSRQHSSLVRHAFEACQQTETDSWK